MRPVGAAGIRIEVQCPRLGKHVGGCGRVGDEPVDVDIAVAIGEVDAGCIMMALEEAAAPQIDASLETGKVTAGARIGEVLVAVVDLLPEEAHPAGSAPAGAERTALGVGQRIADALVQRAERREAELSRDGRRRIRFRQLYAAFKRLPLCTTPRRVVGPKSYCATLEPAKYCLVCGQTRSAVSAWSEFPHRKMKRLGWSPARISST